MVTREEALGGARQEGVRWGYARLPARIQVGQQAIGWKEGLVPPSDTCGRAGLVGRGLAATAARKQRHSRPAAVWKNRRVHRLARTRKSPPGHHHIGASGVSIEVRSGSHPALNKARTARFVATERGFEVPALRQARGGPEFVEGRERTRGDWGAAPAD